MTTLLLFLGGAVTLVAGAELLVRGASHLATAAGVSPLVVGLTVVAFGTSAPELAVTTGAAVTGQAGVALGNVLGSNIFNVLFILGLSAVIAPLVVSHRLVRIDVPVMIGASVLALGLAVDGRIGRRDGVVLLAGFIVYTTWLFVRRKSGADAVRPAAPPGPRDAPDPGGRRPRVRDLASISGGLLLLVVGARWLVSAAVDAAASLGVSELVVGLTIVAAGTSLPEVATSVLASIRGQRDIAVGNVVGSNLFNLLAVLGLGSLVAPAGIPVSEAAVTFDFPIMIAVAVATLPILFTGYLISRWEGLLFLGYYGAYTAYLVLHTSRHQAADELRAAMLWFVLPLTLLTLAVLAARAIGDDGRPPGRT